MAQKIIKIGKSAGVTLPKEELQRAGLKEGDRVTVEYDEARSGFFVKGEQGSVRVDRELIEWTDQFIEDYRPALEGLSQK